MYVYLLPCVNISQDNFSKTTSRTKFGRMQMRDEGREVFGFVLDLDPLLGRKLRGFLL